MMSAVMESNSIRLRRQQLRRPGDLPIHRSDLDPHPDQCRATGCRAFGRQPSEGELLYIAHFLGPDGTSKLIDVAASQPGANAVEVFPRSAAANPRIFRSLAHAQLVQWPTRERPQTGRRQDLRRRVRLTASLTA
jgi:hypothetical protein